MDEYNLLNNSAPSQPVQPVQTAQPKAHSGGVGSVIGAIIIIILLALGALYFWGARLNNQDTNPPPLILGNETASADPTSDAASGLPPQQTSDDASAISADLQAMDFGQFDAQIDSSLQGFQQSAQ